MKMDHVQIENRNKDISLMGLFGSEVIGDLQRKIAEATGFSVFTIDYRGEKVVAGFEQEYYKNYLLKGGEGNIDRISEALAAAKSAIINRPYLFRGRNGLVKIAIPIIVNGQYLGALVCGYVCCGDPDYVDPATGEVLIQTDVETGSVGQAGQEELKAFPVWSAEKIRAVSDLVYHMISEMCQKEDYALRLGDSEHNKVHLWDLRKKNRELKKMIQEMKLISMKNNIQPQILLNMLATLFNFAVMENAVKTQEIAEIFTSFLRYYVEFGRDYVSVGQEISQVERYLEVLKRQYQDRLDIRIDKSPENESQLIPKLIIFPLVEYIFNFGILSSNYRGVIHIDTEYTIDRFVLTLQFEHTGKYLKSMGYLNASGNVFDERFYLEQLNLLEQRIAYEYSEDYKISIDPELIILDLPRNSGSIDERGLEWI